MILTITIGSAITPLSLAACRSLVASVANVGFDAVFFVRSAGVMLDAVPLIAALASVPVSIGLGASVPAGVDSPLEDNRSRAVRECPCPRLLVPTTSVRRFRSACRPSTSSRLRCGGACTPRCFVDPGQR